MFQCITAISAFAQRSVKSIRIYFETSHGKSKSDGLGGVVRSCASCKVCSTTLIIQNARELLEYCEKRLTVLHAQDKTMVNCCFFYMSEKDIES